MEELFMNILVLGNGFDLAHGLPTKYEHFLEFVDIYKKYRDILIPGESIKSAWEKEEGLRQEFLLYLANLCDQKKKIFAELAEMISENIWIDYFLSIFTQMKQEGREGWIDFESEISNIVQEFESIRLEMLANIKNDQEVTYLKPYQIDKLERFFINDEEPETLEGIAKIKKQMLENLNKLIRALEIYLSDYVNNLPVSKRLPDIDELKIDKVLSFNYTNTYERIYGKDKPDIKYDYIHGKAEITHDINSCKLVLGIDEYLIGEERNSNTEFIQFKKFFQRIYKKTGCKYVDWLKEYEANNIGKYASLEAEDLNVYIFGHSLDVTDKDIMRRLILSEAGRMFKRDGLKAQTTIFHFNQEAMGSQIANLVKVIGQDNLISMVHGSDAKIILQQQQDAI